MGWFSVVPASGNAAINGAPGTGRQTELRRRGKNFVFGTALQLTLRRMRTLFRHPGALVTIVAVIVVLGVSGPFGTLELFTIGPRFAYWAVVVVSTFTAGYFAGSLATEILTPDDNFYLSVPLAGVSSGVPVTLLVLAINALTHPQMAFDFAGAGSLLLSCTAVATGVAAVFAAFRKPAATQEELEARQPRLLERLPLPKRGALVSLSVSDHYVDVVTTRGRAMLLMRLSDAIAETEGVPGVQIHRSHWVALGQIAHVHRSGGKTVVETSASDRLPVSRGFMPAARDAGIIT